LCAAITQIAAHRLLTAINAFKDADNISRSAFRVNDDIAVYFKYATKSKRPHDEFVLPPLAGKERTSTTGEVGLTSIGGLLWAK